MNHDDQLSEQDLRDLIQRRDDINRLAWQRPIRKFPWFGVACPSVALFLLLAILSTGDTDMMKAVEIGAGVVLGIGVFIAAVVGARLYFTRER